mgnify:CR=1 FL=1
MPKRNHTPWFIGADKANKPYSFTTDPERAMIDMNGNPVLCPGDVNRVWNAEFSRQRAKRQKLWDKLLDAMENDIELAESQEKAAESGNIMEQRYIKRQRVQNRGIQYGLQFAIAQFELPENRSTSLEEDIAWVEKRAQEKYDQES